MKAQYAHLIILKSEGIIIAPGYAQWSEDLLIKQKVLYPILGLKIKSFFTSISHFVGSPNIKFK